MSDWLSGMRDAFFDSLYDIAVNDERVVLVTADTGAFCHDKWRQNLSHRYINVGIAEQNLVGIAAGLSMSGKVVYTYAIIPFMTMRCYEQVRVDLCCMNLSVTIVGVGAGYDYSTLGPTHHGTEDIALMRPLPGMTVLSPSDNTAASAFAHVTYKLQGPAYVRLSRVGAPLVYEDCSKENFTQGLSIPRPGNDLCIIATGRSVYTAIQVSDKLLKRSINTKVVDLYRIKPLNAELLLETIGDSKYVFTLEEHFLTGGIGSAVAEVLAENERTFRFKRLSLQDKFCRQYGKWEYLQALSSLDAEGVTNAIFKWISSGGLR